MKPTRALTLALAGLVTSTALAAPAEAAVRPLVQGVVVDQGGRHVDDVTVVAEDRHGDPVASALTYASDRAGGPQHGYFHLAVGRAGDYTVSVSKPGYKPAEVGTFSVGRRGVVSLGEVVILKRLVPSTTRLSLDGRSLTTTQRATATVRVSTDETRRPTGAVVVRVDGEKVREVDLAAGDRGSVDVRLPRLARGTHSVRATWAPGSPYVRASASGPVDLTVRKPQHRAARAWTPGSPLLRVLP